MIPALNLFLDSVVDTIAPPIPALENCIYHWEKFISNYLDWTTDGVCSNTHIDVTNIPVHLEHLKQVLLSEDENDNYTTNSSMEYALQNDLFNILAIIAEKEKLIGLRLYILRFMTDLIEKLNNPMLAHQSVSSALLKLINLCDYVLHSEDQTDQIHFLFTLCSLLKSQPNAAVLFLSRDSENYNLKHPTAQPQGLNLLDCLLSYINTKDTNVYILFCKCILILITLEEEIVGNSIVENTKLCLVLCSNLKNLFCMLPTKLDYNGLEAIELKWRTDYDATYSNDVTKFFCWFDFIIEVIKHGQFIISCNICELLKSVLFDEIMYLSLEEISISTVFIIKKMYLLARSSPLIHMINNWIRSPKDSRNAPFETLIKVCYTKDELLTFHVMSFFNVILNELDKDNLEFIVLQYVNNRSYYEGNNFVTWSDEEDEREKKTLLGINKSNTSCTLAPSSIDRIINRLLTLYPQNLQSDSLHTFKNYIKVTNDKYENVFDVCKHFDWPTEAIEIDKTKEFYSGPFLEMIYSKIHSIPNQSPSITLQIKNILILLSFLPHPYLHEYLLNSTVPLKRNVPSAYNTLCQVIKKIQRTILTLPNYYKELNTARERVFNNNTYKLFKNEKEEKSILFDNAVILEELCKEMVAVLFVKYHYFSLYKE
ncbi:FHF complex subunit HOOK interacting protein 2A-like [Adelges cooleyi]|uniref:FHF complex subunit HOOK interacting protein 2A-like n=1 Tax=Adelges cooleyi TaxID=133065 RepID=UPI00217FF1F5|nr:FHF complex subunit HOOK interacting protein 2A-like [Adelges cooleyi]